MNKATRVLIVDDNPDVVLWLSTLLELTEGLEVAGTANDPEDAGRIARLVRPDVAIVDVAMPRGGGITATKLITSVSETTAVLIFSGAGDSNAVIEMLKRGAVGYIGKPASGEEIIAAILGAARGLTILSAEMTPPLRRELTKSARLDLGIRIDESASVERLLEDARFRAVFQPIVELKSRRIRGYEALTRFPDGSPEEWFASAWRVGRGPELELRAIELAIAAFHALPGESYLSLNISPATLSHRGLTELIEVCDPHRVVLEITEHAEIEDIETFRPALQKVRELGARIAVDDAGAGFANFVRMLEVVPDVIKLDRVLVENVDNDRIRAAITESLISLATKIGARIAAEGIETESEACTLENLGVQFGQGYLFGRPAPLQSWIAKGSVDK